ncbi:hypothetical protein ASPFODRAFT_484622 [Aspergillus luchuensis CBS 106.47]|uniref:Uncharacterized protein n=1 Tax=Aspergillus luchuensis (strain CBS 106.47) TaxID=1137211 RepID=A0A1M3TRN8_ASPLC|nr:hypothetical protein ASPFODRAFT_484622 [Aspergillus luchuensis CBS 106.47]
MVAVKRQKRRSLKKEKKVSQSVRARERRKIRRNGAGKQHGQERRSVIKSHQIKMRRARAQEEKVWPRERKYG